jgi:hypothetical protein
MNIHSTKVLSAIAYADRPKTDWDLDDAICQAGDLDTAIARVTFTAKAKWPKGSETVQQIHWPLQCSCNK